MNEKIVKNKSKLLSLVLRHSPETIGLKLDPNGWVFVSDLIAQCNRHQHPMDEALLTFIVENNDKKRFAFNEDKTKIRASQGHSVEINLALEAKTPPAFLYHGTAEKTVALIRTSGIMKMNRQHVHLSQEKETATKVGSRHGKPVVLTILAEKMSQDGILFYQSENGVWLTDFVDSKYISK
jgi:putative RNA 2'-phosphotransferase